MPKMAEAVLLDIYDAWRAHNVDLLATYLPEDFVHSINIPTATHPLGGDRHGKAAALERFSLIFREFDLKALETNPLAITAGDATIDVHTRCLHRPTGTWLNTTKRHLWKLELSWPVQLCELYDLDDFRSFAQAAHAV
jgi:ketosteroid isomerase-like protein